MPIDAKPDLPPKAAPPSLQARKQELMRDAMWDAAIDLFAQKGFDETTADEIAQAAGVSRRSFFRYFSSKGELMGQGMVSYGAVLSEAIQACPSSFSLREILREVVLRVAQQSAAQPRTRKIMEIAAKYPAAREAQIARIAEVQERVAEAFATRCRTDSKETMTPHLLAGLTLSILGVAFRAWFENGTRQDISVTVDQILKTLAGLVCEHGEAGEKKRNKAVAVKQKVKRRKG